MPFLIIIRRNPEIAYRLSGRTVGAPPTADKSVRKLLQTRAVNQERETYCVRGQPRVPHLTHALVEPRPTFFAQLLIVIVPVGQGPNRS